MSDRSEELNPTRKALLVNLQKNFYGTIAEIGAGQEVANLFFHAGGASGTVAKAMSAYDMNFSDAIYGKTSRYVSRERLKAMLAHEYILVLDRLDAIRGADSRFFAFANTVATKSFRSGREGHGWMGLRFQSAPQAQPNDIIIHVRLSDRDSMRQQQETIGIMGVNLIYSACFLQHSEDQIIDTLLDDLSRERAEIDYIELSGPSFAQTNNRLTALKMVKQGLSNAVMFSTEKEVLQPADALYRRPVVVERGRFKPVTYLHLDMMQAAQQKFAGDLAADSQPVASVMELTLSNLLEAEHSGLAEVLKRLDMLAELGFTTMVSNYPEFYRLASYLHRLTKEPVGIVLGVDMLIRIFDERFYENLEGGILESFGRMFTSGVRFYVYPMLRANLLAYAASLSPQILSVGFPEVEIITAENVLVPGQLMLLLRYLRERGYILPIAAGSGECLQITTAEVSAMVAAGDQRWRKLVPTAVHPLVEPVAK